MFAFGRYIQRLARRNLDPLTAIVGNRGHAVTFQLNMVPILQGARELTLNRMLYCTPDVTKALFSVFSTYLHRFEICVSCLSAYGSTVVYAICFPWPDTGMCFGPLTAFVSGSQVCCRVYKVGLCKTLAESPTHAFVLGSTAARHSSVRRFLQLVAHVSSNSCLFSRP